MSNRPRLVIGGTGSGVGKTTLTLGLMAAFKRRGLKVQGFKAGPDYIDPTYHTAVTGRPSRNLDTWMVEPDVMREVFWRGSAGADLSIIEGVMGFYDGKDPKTNRGSTAEISMLLEAPVLLLVNIASMARSAAAIVKGFATLTEEVQIAGVVANQAGSAGHISLAKTAIEQECDIPVIGGFVRQAGIEIPERHLGLVPAIERGELTPLFEKLADLVESALDLDAILQIANAAPDVEPASAVLFGQASAPVTNIAVARDAAFNFYYQENLELLEQNGAKLLFFSPLAGEKVPEQAEGLYIGGGFPEEFAAELSGHEAVRADLKQRIADGLPTLAECGGYMYLCDTITDRAGETYAMSGVVPGAVGMQKKLAALGYREVTALTDNFLFTKSDQARGHEFHYSTLVEAEPFPAAYHIKGLRGEKAEGYASHNLVAGYTHLYFPSNPAIAKRFVEGAKRYGQTRR
ncbi:cobyrinic acid a,c-diamide synthase [Tumebacillus algifaecis]|uniref:Cobyrinate a,c-diamide synthase n=1 Tax=Tumebacillus algifaecis TaxID=1214604 RepID=A0A223D6P4_9BACL|nr:cobyrinate a,c-diamide synthase [Tumebacillus algifaecis]ASS77262.1 cobyrinic acid a,c-diamide synthase [Tumebacillus algifaecis]